MTPPVFLAPAGCVLRAGEPLVLDGAEAHHAVNARRIAAGQASSPLRPLESTIATLQIMDAARAITGETFAEPTA